MFHDAKLQRSQCSSEANHSTSSTVEDDIEDKFYLSYKVISCNSILLIIHYNFICIYVIARYKCNYKFRNCQNSSSQLSSLVSQADWQYACASSTSTMEVSEPWISCGGSLFWRWNIAWKTIVKLKGNFWPLMSFELSLANDNNNDNNKWNKRIFILFVPGILNLNILT